MNYYSKKSVLLFLIVLLIQLNLFANDDNFNRISKLAQENNWHDLPINKIMLNIALEFVGTPYVGGTLDNNNVEKCTVHFDKFDCVTYFETVMAMAHCFKLKKYNTEDVTKAIEKSRYRNAKVTDYTSRLHYTSDWIYHNINNGNISDITKNLGGETIMFNTYFMSKNPEKYNALKNSPDLVSVIHQQEMEINSRTYYYIPKSKIHLKMPEMKSCDIIALSTSVGGLDYSHIGFAFIDRDGNLRFLHASSSKKKVVLDGFLCDYLDNKKYDTGITVLRVNDFYTE